MDASIDGIDNSGTTAADYANIGTDASASWRSSSTVIPGIYWADDPVWSSRQIFRWYTRNIYYIKTNFLSFFLFEFWLSTIQKFEVNFPSEFLNLQKQIYN